jgi:hypothetical protein
MLSFKSWNSSTRRNLPAPSDKVGMDFQQITKRAVDIRNKYSELELKRYGKEWTREQTMEGFVGDVGDFWFLCKD